MSNYLIIPVESGALLGGADTLKSSLTTDTTAGTPATYTLSQDNGDITTNGSGKHAVLTCVIAAGETTLSGGAGRVGVALGNQGYGYAVGDTITIPAGKLGGSSTEAVLTLISADVVDSAPASGEILAEVDDFANCIGNSAAEFKIQYLSGYDTSGGTPREISCVITPAQSSAQALTNKLTNSISKCIMAEKSQPILDLGDSKVVQVSFG